MALFIQVLSGGDREAIKAAVEPAILNCINNEHGISESLLIPQMYGVAYAADPSIANTFVILDIQVSLPGAQSVIRDVVNCAWNEKVVCLRNGGVSYQWY